MIKPENKCIKCGCTNYHVVFINPATADSKCKVICTCQRCNSMWRALESKTLIGVSLGN